MDLIDRYILEVARHLPEKTAASVATELRSSLAAALEGRVAAAGRPADEAMIAEMLIAFGHPEAVAARYREPRSFIGPAWYPSFQYIAVIVLIVISISKLGGFAVRSVVSPEALTPAVVVTVLTEYIKMVFVGLALTAFVIAGLERVLDGRADDEFGRWDPRELPPADLDDRDTVDRAALERRIVGNAVMLVLFLFFPHWIGVPWAHQYRFTVVPLADLGLHLPVWLLAAFWGGGVVLAAALLRRKRWTIGLRWLELGVGAAGIAAVIAMLTTATPHAINEDWFAARGWPIDAPELLRAGTTMRRLVLALLWSLLGWLCWQTVSRARQFTAGRSVPDSPAV